jgi:hypothetical protein
MPEMAKCPDEVLTADCCAAAIQSLAAAAVCCRMQQSHHRKASDLQGCDLCQQAFELTCQAIQKHLDCLKTYCC